MTKSAMIAAAALAIALTLPACQRGPGFSQVAPQHVPTVTEQVFVHDLTYTGPGQFAPGEMEELAEWLDTIELKYGDRISVDDPNPIGAAARAERLGELVGTHGLLLREAGPVTDPPLPTGVTRLVVVRAQAAVPECPDHSRRSNPDFEGSVTSNFSCATASNMAAMIADPNDLVAGKTYVGGTTATQFPDAATGARSSAAAGAGLTFGQRGRDQ